MSVMSSLRSEEYWIHTDSRTGVYITGWLEANVTPELNLNVC